MNQALVSICIPAYNVEKTIGKTLESLLAQAYPQLEIVVIDNCSTDDTQKVVRKYQAQGVKLQVNEKNIGGEANFERCLNAGSGKYTAVYHADDLYHPSIVAEQVAFLESHDCSAVLCSAEFIDYEGKKVGRSKTFSALGLPDQNHFIFDSISLLEKLMRNFNFLITPSAMFRTEIAKQTIKIWNGKDFGTSADLDVWLRVAKNGGLGLLAQPLMQYRLSIHQGGYQYNLSRTTPADFFKVINFWIGRYEAKLSSAAFREYSRLKRQDQLLCAARALLKNDAPLAYKLHRQTFDASFLVSLRGFGYLSLWLSLYLAKLPFTRPVIKKCMKHYLLPRF